MLFYTGAVQSGAIQSDPSRSLGGWISSSQVPNDMFDNLYGKIDYYQVKNNLKPMRVLAFKTATSPALRVWVEREPTTFATYKIGIVLNSIDPSCGKPYFEQIQDQFSSPFYVELASCEGEDNAIILENIPEGSYVGIFIQRNLIADNNPDLGGGKKTCEQYATEFEATQQPDYEESEEDLEDEIKIIISDTIPS